MTLFTVTSLPDWRRTEKPGKGEGKREWRSPKEVCHPLARKRMGESWGETRH